MTDEVLITGARGWIGGHLVRSMSAAGWHVTGVSRTPAAAPATPGCSWLGTGPELDDAVARIGVVVNLAGRHPFEQHWDDDFKAAMVASRVGFTQRIVAALRRSRAENRVLVSGSGFPVYGDAGEAELTEDAPVSTATFLARMDAEWERAAEEATDAGVRVVRARLGLGLGADGGALPILRAAAEAGTPQSFGPGHQWVPWVHIEDLVDLLHRAVVDARWHGAVNMAAPAPVRHRSMIEALAQLSGTGPVVEIGVEDVRATLGEAAEILLVSTRLVPRRSLGWGYRFRHDAMTDALASLFPLTSHR